MTENEVNWLIKSICKIYTRFSGDLLSLLDFWDFSYSEKKDGYSFLVFSKYSPSGEQLLELEYKRISAMNLELLFKELESREWLRKTENNGYSLTELGLEAGTRGALSKALLFLNRNPGVSTIIALFALFISCISLYISATKP